MEWADNENYTVKDTKVRTSLKHILSAAKTKYLKENPSVKNISKPRKSRKTLKTPAGNSNGTTQEGNQKPGNQGAREDGGVDTSSSSSDDQQLVNTQATEMDIINDDNDDAKSNDDQDSTHDSNDNDDDVAGNISSSTDKELDMSEESDDSDETHFSFQLDQKEALQ